MRYRGTHRETLGVVLEVIKRTEQRVRVRVVRSPRKSQRGKIHFPTWDELARRYEPVA